MTGCPLLDSEYAARQNGKRLPCERLAEENERLRELVQDIMTIVCDRCYERLCKMPKEEHPFVTCSFADRMRELGVDA